MTHHFAPVSRRPSDIVCRGFKPQPSPLMLRHPLAGHALGLGDLGGGQLGGEVISGFLRVLVTLRGRKGAGNAPDNGPDPFMTGIK